MRGSRRRKGDGVWEVRVYLGRDPATGRVKQLSRTVRGSAREADEVLRDLVASFGGVSAEGVAGTVGQLLDRWLEECERLERSPTTLRNHRSQIERTIRPALGAIRVSRLTLRVRGAPDRRPRPKSAVMPQSQGLFQESPFGRVRCARQRPHINASRVLVQVGRARGEGPKPVGVAVKRYVYQL